MIFSKSAAVELCALNLAAYDLSETGACTLPDGFSAPAPVRVPHVLEAAFIKGDPIDCWGFATTKGDMPYLVLRGTEITKGLNLLQEWAEDLYALPMKTVAGGEAHRGFGDLWQAIRQASLDALDSVATGCNTRIITGHSLGAALATLCWADITGELMTFACPRVGNAAFAAGLDSGNTVRVVNAPDLIPKLPTDPPFHHGGTEIVLNGPGGNIAVAHILSSYAAALQALPEAATAT